MLRRLFLFVLFPTAAVILTSSGAAAVQTQLPARTATIVDVDLASGVARVTGPDRRVLATPGSTLKPLLLIAALRQGSVTPQTRIACAGKLRVAGHDLACTHPTGPGVLDAEEALAYSCNTYFARLAEHLPATGLRAALQQYGIDAPDSMRTPDSRVIVALGLNGVTVSPVQLADAYSRLARDLASSSVESEVVRDGLVGSVNYGMAHAAETQGLLLAGKTGTAPDPAPLFQHGWFAGIVFAKGKSPIPQHVVVVYVPGDSGNDAAKTAHEYLEHRRW